MCSRILSPGIEQNQILEKEEQQSNVSEEDAPRTSANGSGEFEQGELKCCFCLQEDSSDNLHKAGTFHATKRKADGTHVSHLTHQWREMAAVLGDNVLLGKISVGDVAANELFIIKTV